MKNTDMMSNISKVLVYTTQNMSDVSYESLETIAKYNSRVKASTIKAIRNNDNNTTSIEITTQQPISNFTIKIIKNTNIISADYDGTEIFDNEIRYKNGFYYIYHNVDSGTHTINITDSGIPIQSFSSSSASGKVPLTVTFNDTSLIKSDKWYWDFESDSKIDSTQENPVHVFTHIGTYSVNMTVYNSNGTFSCIKTIKVNPFTTDILNKPYWFLYNYLNKLIPMSVFS